MNFKHFLSPDEQTIADISCIFDEFRKKNGPGNDISSAILTLAAVIDNNAFNGLTDYCERVQEAENQRKQHEIQQQKRLEWEEHLKNCDPVKTAQRIREITESLTKSN